MKQNLILFLIFISSLGFAQQTDKVDFIRGNIEIFPNVKTKQVKGKTTYTFEILQDVNSVYIDAIDAEFELILLDNKKVAYKNDRKKIWIKHPFKKGSVHTIAFYYQTTPKKAFYVVKKDKDWQIWTQGQGKYTSNWLPSFDDMNEKVEFDLSVTYKNGYEVISNGKLISKQANDSTTTWQYDMQQPMSSYLLALAIGKYNKKTEISKRGIPLEMYYYPKDSLKVESTYRYSKQIFDFLEDEIGVVYPWQNYKQIPVKDFLYAGMENTSATIFADSFVTDSIGFVDRNYVNVNAHELAHQWFGDLVTETSGTHHWLQEGFATYYALLAEKEIFGDAYFYWKLYEHAQELQKQEIQGQSTSLLDPKSNSLTFYQKGALTLFMLRERVGDTAFKKAIKAYLQKHQFKNVETNDFISEVETISHQNLDAFVSLWINDKKFPYEDIIKVLKTKSTFLWEYEMVDCDVWNSKCDKHLKYPISDKAKIKLISQRPDRVTTETFKNSIEVRQAIASYVTKIPLKLKAEYESLLNDNSYQTKEIALYNLWNNFETDRVKYLNKINNVHGFSDKNVRTLWLALALVTPNYEIDKKQMFLNELIDYTSSKYGFEVRQNAFRYLKLISACEAECKSNLNGAKTHHNWRFSNFAKNLFARN